MTREDTIAISELMQTHGLSQAPIEHISGRLAYLYKLEQALAWRDTGCGGLLFRALSDRYELAPGAGYVADHVERHDSMPSGRAAALVRLWERVTGGVKPSAPGPRRDPLFGDCEEP